MTRGRIGAEMILNFLCVHVCERTHVCCVCEWDGNCGSGLARIAQLLVGVGTQPHNGCCGGMPSVQFDFNSSEGGCGMHVQKNERIFKQI